VIFSQAILGKAVGTLLARVAASYATIASSKRRKSARYLVKLYYALEALDSSTERILLATRQGSGKAHALFRVLQAEQDAIEFASNAFVDLSRDMQRGLAMLNPALHQMCQVIYRGKADFLSLMSVGLSPDYSKVPPQFSLWVPTSELIATDFDAAYQESKQVVQSGSEYYWPSGAFDYFAETEEVVLTPDSDDSAIRLLNSLECQNKILKTAKEELRVFIKESFSVEEILFHKEGY
jgi:hypothetical protein